MAGLDGKTLNDFYGTKTQGVVWDPLRPEGIFVPNHWISQVGSTQVREEFQGCAPNANAGYGFKVHWPYVHAWGELRNSPADVFQLEQFEQLVLEFEEWLFSGVLDDFGRPPQELWKWAIQPHHNLKKNGAGNGLDPISQSRRWEYEHCLAADKINGMMKLAHNLNMWGRLDIWYPFIYAKMSRFDQAFKKQYIFGKETPFDEPDQYPGHPKEWIELREKWMLSLLDGSAIKVWNKTAKKRKNQGLPSPPLAPSLTYVPFWWIMKHPGNVKPPEVGSLLELSPKIKPWVDAPDTGDVIAQVFKQAMLTIVISAVTAGVAEAAWQATGAPLGNMGLEIYQGSVGGGLDAALSGNNILDGIAGGALDSLTPDDIFEAVDMGLFGDGFGDFFDTTVDFLGGAADDLGEIGGILEDLDSFADVIGSFGSVSSTGPVAPPIISQSAEAPLIEGLQTSVVSSDSNAQAILLGAIGVGLLLAFK
jgi:hypothetical protein